MMQAFNYSLIFVFGLLFSSLSHANEKQFSRDEWIKLLSNEIPNRSCQEDQFFKVCFKVNQNKCEEIMSSAVKICVGQYRHQIPAKMVRSMGGPWGSKIGECSGITYAQKLQSQFIASDYCNNFYNQ